MGHPVSSCETSRFQQVSVSLDDDFVGETWARSQAMRLKSLISMVDAVGIEPTTLPVKGALSSSCIGDDAMKFTSKDCGLFDGCGGLVEPREPIGRPRFLPATMHKTAVAPVLLAVSGRVYPIKLVDYAGSEAPPCTCQMKVFWLYCSLVLSPVGWPDKS